MKIHVLLLRDETDMKRVGCRVVAKAYGCLEPFVWEPLIDRTMAPIHPRIN